MLQRKNGWNGFDPLRFEHSVERGLVHRASVAEVFVMDMSDGRCAGEFVVGAQLPRLHGLYRPVDGRHDSMLLAEVIRQTSISVAHRFFDVPFGSFFTMQSLGFELHDWTPMAVSDVPLDVTIRVTATDVQRRGGQTCALDLDMELFVAGRELGTGHGHARIFDEVGYQKVRWSRGVTSGELFRTAVPVPRASVGVSDRDDVVLGPDLDASRWVLRVDTKHPILFDHGCDHVPGMVLFEAVRQAARLAIGDPGALLSSIQVQFSRFGELDRPVFVQVDRCIGGEFAATFMQDDVAIAQATAGITLSGALASEGSSAPTGSR